MDFFSKLDLGKGGYIFLSHSHADIEKVREIRNALEENGFEPLCFYLKCLNDDSEIEDLIKREIDAREWFVFVNSENSRNSRWVTLEREYIQSTNSKKIITVSIEDERSVRGAIEKITHGLRVFISYSKNGKPIAARINKRLRERDYLTFFADDFCGMGKTFYEDVKSAIVRASQDGCVLAVITQDFMQSRLAMNEIMLAIQCKGNVVPVFVGDVKLSTGLQLMLSTTQWLQLSSDPSDEEINRLVDEIGKGILER